MLEAMVKLSPKAFDLSLSRGQSPNPSWPLSPVEQLAPNNSPCSLPFLNNSLCPLPFLNNSLHPLPFFNNDLHLLPLPNSNLHSFPTNGLCSLPDNSLCHFPYSWKPSLIMWMLLDWMMRGFLPQHKPQEQPLSTPRVDMEFVDLGEVHDHCDNDEEEVTLEGGPFSKEEHAGIDEIYQNILALAEGFGKKHCQSVQCVLTKLFMGFAS